MSIRQRRNSFYEALQNALHESCFNKSAGAILETTKAPSLTDGQTYDIEFGVIDVDEKTVKVLLKIDDTVYFEQELTHEDFVNSEFYFGIVASGSKATISAPDAK